MRFARSGPVVSALQWPLAVLLPGFVFFGRAIFGAELGWMAVFGFVFGPALLILLLIPPLLTLFDREARRSRSTRSSYAAASIVLWVAAVVAGLALSDMSDMRPFPSPLEQWTGISSGASMAVFTVAVIVAAAAWLGMLVAAVAGIVRSRRAPAGGASPGGGA